jgi:hypothetical protein
MIILAPVAANAVPAIRLLFADSCSESDSEEEDDTVMGT